MASLDARCGASPSITIVFLKKIERHMESCYPVMACVHIQLTLYSPLKLTVPHLVETFSTFHATRRLVTVFATRNLSLSWPTLVKFTPFNTIYLRTCLILSFHLHLALLSGLLPSGFPTKTLYASLVSPYILHSLPISSTSI